MMSNNNDLDNDLDNGIDAKDDLNLDFNNTIESYDKKDIDDDADLMPDVDVTTNRKSSNAKKLKMMGLAVLALLLVLVASGITFNRYQEAKELKKQEEAEQALANQQNVKTNASRIDIGEEQSAIESQEMYDLPPPADANEPILLDAGGTPPPQPLPEPAPAPIMMPEPTAPPTAVPASRPNYNDSSTPSSPPMMSFGNSNNSNNFDSEPMNDFTPPPPPPTPEELKRQRLLGSGVMAYENSGVTSVSGGNGNGNGGIYSATALADGTASKRGDTSMLLMKGTSIPCVLRTRIVSDYKGFTTCQVSKDVYSANGRVLLIERGSKVFGEQNIEIKQGQSSVFVLWTKVETPKGITVNLESPAVGQLGEMGVKANVNNHFWKRFGGAIMLSLIQDALDVASTKAKGGDDSNRGGNNNTTVQNTSNTAENMAEKALDSTINIPPTATVPQGTVMNILVVRDIDFGGVYGLR